MRKVLFNKGTYKLFGYTAYYVILCVRIVKITKKLRLIELQSICFFTNFAAEKVNTGYNKMNKVRYKNKIHYFHFWGVAAQL